MRTLYLGQQTMAKQTESSVWRLKSISFVDGFSLFEVLISLLLVSSISLALLKQQWKSNAFFISMIHQIDVLVETDNQHELNLYLGQEDYAKH